MPDRWFYRAGTQWKGPVSTVALRQLLVSGVVGPETSLMDSNGCGQTLKALIQAAVEVTPPTKDVIQPPPTTEVTTLATSNNSAEKPAESHLNTKADFRKKAGKLFRTIMIICAVCALLSAWDSKDPNDKSHRTYYLIRVLTGILTHKAAE